MNTRTFIDQMGRPVSVCENPQRIISLVPSQTELLADLGLENEVIGITKFCIHPDRWFRSKTRIGGTKKLNLEQLAALQPDLIIANKEENEQSQIEWLMARFPVWMSDIKTLAESCAMITAVGELTGKQKEAGILNENIKVKFDLLENFLAEKKQLLLRAAYFIWQEPMMCAGSDTFISHVMQRCGLENVFNESEGRYPEVTPAQLLQLQPDVLLLSSEPFPFGEKHRELWQQQFPDIPVVLVDGEYFSWYGSRLQLAPPYFMELRAGLNALIAP